MSFLKQLHKTLKQINKKIFVDNKRITGIVGIILIFIVIAAVFSYEASAIETKDAKEVLLALLTNVGFDVDSEQVESQGSLSFNGQTSERGQYTQVFTLEHEALIEVSASLSWNDEDPGRGRTNKADEFKITLTSPTGETVDSTFVSNSESGNLAGTIPAITIYIEAGEDAAGDWEVIVEAGDCGDLFGPLGRFSYQSDDGNSWELSINYKYYATE